MVDEELIHALEELVVLSGAITSRAFAEVHPEVRTLTVHQYRDLALVAAAADGLRVGELARRSSSRPQTTTRIIQRLEAKKLVQLERGADADDRRAVVVRLTDHGRETWEEISQRRRELLGRALEGTTMSREAGALLETIVGALARYTA
jgi:DNA-binding MarR family transcriptional regulator